ncbi:MAG: hypothetical protein NZM34_01485 [Bernardetiaceae bacterium]|nr:hypothetical protein [Bernardetiaceae bacterium]
MITSLPAWCSPALLWYPEKKDTIDILSAKQTNRIRVSIRGAYNPHYTHMNPASSHYGECMEMRIENITDSVLHVVLPCGTMLLSLDSSAQNMLVSETRYFTLYPRQKKYERINALCGELHKNAPDVYVNYQVGTLAPEPLLKLAHIIEANSAQNKIGQYAVWAVTDKATRHELGEDYEILQASQRLLTMAGIAFNIMGKSESSAAAVNSAANHSISGNNEANLNHTSINKSSVNSELPFIASVTNDTISSATPIAADGDVTSLGVADVEPQYQLIEQGTASEWVVYGIGAVLLGLGIYLLGKNTTRGHV